MYYFFAVAYSFITLPLRFECPFYTSKLNFEKAYSFFSIMFNFLFCFQNTAEVQYFNHQTETILNFFFEKLNMEKTNDEREEARVYLIFILTI